MDLRSIRENWRGGGGEWKRVLALVLIMTGVSALIGGTAVGVLYRTARRQQRARLVESVQSYARLMEAVARFDRIYSRDYPGGWEAATLSQVQDAGTKFRRPWKTAEFTIARREGDRIVFILRDRHAARDMPKRVPFKSKLAEPMRRALSGISGTMIGLDYRGVKVLAAHEPVDLLNLGLVAKIDLAEIRAPFLKTGGIVAGIGLIVIIGGALLFFRVSNPMIRRIRESEGRFREMFEGATVSLWEQDISVLKAAIADLKSRGVTDFRRYVEEHPDFVRQAAKMVKIIDINDATLRLYGAESKGEVIGSLDRIFVPETLQVFRAVVIAIAEGKTHFDAETVNRTLRGEQIDIMMSIAIPPADSNTDKILVSIMDITGRKKAEEELRRAQGRLLHAEKLASVGTLVSGVAHEILNPINVLSIKLQMLQRGMGIEDPKKLDESLALMGEQVSRVTKITKNLLDFARHREPELRSLDVRNVMDKVADLVEYQYRVTNIEVVREYEETVPEINGDPDQLSQVFLNLIRNAREAMPEGGGGAGSPSASGPTRSGGRPGSGSRLRTPGAACPRRSSTGSSIPSSPPRGRARERVWGSPSLTGSSRITAAGST